jgi:hypothetical protein
MKCILRHTWYSRSGDCIGFIGIQLGIKSKLQLITTTRLYSLTLLISTGHLIAKPS